MTSEQINSVIDNIALKLQVPVESIYNTLVKQVQVDLQIFSLSEIITFLYLVGFVYVSYIVFFKHYKDTNESYYSFFNKKYMTSYDDNFSFAGILFAGILFSFFYLLITITTIFIGLYFIDLICKIIQINTNPDFYILNYILNSFKY